MLRPLLLQPPCVQLSSRRQLAFPCSPRTFLRHHPPQGLTHTGSHCLCAPSAGRSLPGLRPPQALLPAPRTCCRQAGPPPPHPSSSVCGSWSKMGVTCMQSGVFPSCAFSALLSEGSCRKKQECWVFLRILAHRPGGLVGRGLQLHTGWICCH